MPSKIIKIFPLNIKFSQLIIKNIYFLSKPDCYYLSLSDEKMNENISMAENARIYPTQQLNPVFLKEDDLELQNDDPEAQRNKPSAKATPPLSKDKDIELVNLEETELLLPKKVPFSNYSLQMNKNIPNSLDPELTVVLSSLIEKIGEKIFIFDKKELQNFHFRLPNTIFSEADKFSLGKTQKKRSEADDKLAEQFDRESRPKIRMLNRRQFSQIWKTASFTSRSPLPDHDFTWKLSAWIFSGRKKIVNRLFNMCAFSCEQVYEMPMRFYEEKHRMRFCLPNVYAGFYSIYRFFLNLVSIFVGYPKKTLKDVNSKKLKIFMLMQHMEKILNNINIDKSFFLFLDANNNNRKILLDLQKEFDLYWSERKDNLCAEFAIDDENYLQNIQDLYYHHFYEFIDKTNKLSVGNKKLLIDHIKAAVIINKSEFYHKTAADKKINSFDDNLKKNHSFLSRVDKWRENRSFSFENSVKNAYKMAILDESTQFLAQSPDTAPFSILLSVYYDFMIKFNDNIKIMKKEEIKRLKKDENNFSPYRVIEIRRYYYPPGKIKLSEEDAKYYLEEYSENYIETTFFGWRFVALAYRYWNWSNNVTLFLFYNAINGQYGIKALIFPNEFYTNIKVNPTTGAAQPTGEPTETVISTFKNVMKSISKSRKDFEDSPDTGIFGKKFTRICNLIENYIYKFLFLGVILDLICFPLVILLNTILCLVLSSTAYLWVFIVMVFYWVIQLFFYDFDNEGDPLGDASNSAQEFPLFFEILCTLILFGFVQIFLAIAFVFAIYPLLMVAAVILGVIYYFFATIYDCLMIVVIYILGREPQSNTILAWKISGPGVTLDYFNQVELEDIFVSVRVFLEKFELMIFNSRILKMIEEPKLYTDSLYHQIFSKTFGTQKPETPKELTQIQSVLTDKLKQQIHQRQHCFPKAPKNVRLSSEELDIVVTTSEKLIVEFVSARKMELIWKHFKLKKNEWRNLTKMILSQIFTEDILEPLEELDKRVKLKPRQSTYYNKIVEVLKGETGDTYKNLVIKKKDGKNDVNYNEVAPYIKLSVFTKCENYFATFVNSLYIYTDLNLMQNVIMKEEKKEKENEE